MDGLAALAAFKKIDRDVPIIVLSAQSRPNIVVETMRLGAADFVSKPFQPEDLEASLASVLRLYQLRREAATLYDDLESTPATLLGQSEGIGKVRQIIDRVADTDVTVLIRGERGTGKEFVARALHTVSSRRDRPFVKVNCAAVPGGLLEAELFGFERGAFSGALNARPGKFEFANHGTIFLEEIAGIGPVLQAKLLPLLQQGAFSRVGGKSHVEADVRIIAATSQDLEAMRVDGRFREDLFLRLSGVVISVPPLRERRQDIPVLTDYFVKKYSAQYHRPHASISSDTMRLFMDCDWPGNVGELENVIKRAVALGSDAAFRQDISRTAPATRRAEPVPAAPPPRLARAIDGVENYSLKEISRSAAREAERVLILKMLQRTCWNRKEAAGILGISYKALLYKIKESGLDKPS